MKTKNKYKTLIDRCKLDYFRESRSLCELALNAILRDEGISERNIQIMMRYYFTDATYRSLSKEYNVSKDRVAQIAWRVMRHLYSRETRRKLFSFVSPEYKMLAEKEDKLQHALHTTQNSIRKIERGYTGHGSRKIADLELSVRAKNVLHEARLKTVGDVAELGVRELLKLRNCGMKTVRELEEVVEQEGFEFESLY